MRAHQIAYKRRLMHKRYRTMTFSSACLFGNGLISEKQYTEINDAIDEIDRKEKERLDQAELKLYGRGA